jgi:chromosome segregation ATPase
MDEVTRELERVSGIASGAASNADKGALAWQHVSAALHNYASLDARLSAMDSVLEDLDEIAKGNQTAIKNAKGTYNSLLARFTALDTIDDGFDRRIGNLEDEITNARQNEESLVANLNKIIGDIEENAGGITDIKTYITNVIEAGITNIETKIGYTDEETINASPATNVK